MKAISIAFVVAKIGATGLEFLTSPRLAAGCSLQWAPHMLRAAAFAVVFAFLAVSAAPAFAAAGTIVFTAGLIALSRAKLAFIRVPLGFAHLAFSADSFRAAQGVLHQLSDAAVPRHRRHFGHDRGRLVLFRAAQATQVPVVPPPAWTSAPREWRWLACCPAWAWRGDDRARRIPCWRGGPAGASVLPCRPPTCGLTGYCSRESAKGAAVERAAATATAQPRRMSHASGLWEGNKAAAPGEPGGYDAGRLIGQHQEGQGSDLTSV